MRKLGKRVKARIAKGCKDCALNEELYHSPYLLKVKCRKYGTVPFRNACLDFQIMNCVNCRLMNTIKVNRIRERTNNGDIHYKYYYDSTIDCKIEGEVTTRLEGTRYKATIPTCSLWEHREKETE